MRVSSFYLSGLLRLSVAVAFILFLGTAFRTGWNRFSTDFPNYYTAAVAVREHQPLHNFYDWSWFEKEMNQAGVQRHIGSYAAQTPLTMLPMIAFAGTNQQAAKRIWLAINLLLLAATVGMLARASRIRWEAVALLLFSGFTSLSNNFVYGQYYVFLLFLLTLTFVLLQRGRAAAGGLVGGATFALKLYSGPLLLYFAAKRRWHGVAGMAAGLAICGVVAVTLFGSGDILQYLGKVLPRSMEAGSIDPYNVGNPTPTTFLLRTFMKEPGLNPQPLLEFPQLYFFSQTLLQLGILTFTTLGIAARQTDQGYDDFAWFVIALLLMSTSVASYTYVVLLLPIVILLGQATLLKKVCLISSYILLNAGLKSSWLMPKLWLLLLLFCVVGLKYWRSIKPLVAACAAALVLLVSFAISQMRMTEFAKEPGRHYQQVATRPDSLFSGYPAINSSGLFFQAMGDVRKGEHYYVLRWLHQGRSDSVPFAGHVLYPRTIAGQAAVWFQLVDGNKSREMRFDPLTGTAVPEPIPQAALDGPSKSPDGKWIAVTRPWFSGTELMLVDALTGKTQRLAGGRCNNLSPAWEVDSSAIVFASDCGRAYGLPALYRAPVPRPE